VATFDNIYHLREQAARCMRLAKGCADSSVAESLMALAADYLERAAKLAGSAEGQAEWAGLQ
jgi:hypothetical protein